MIRLELDPEIEARLAGEAQAHGLAIEHYLERLLSSTRDEGRSADSPAEAVAAIRRLRNGLRLDGLSVSEMVREGRKY